MRNLSFVNSTRRLLACAFAAALASAAGAGALAAQPVTALPASALVFTTHATFFSQEAGQSPALDPQVFVLDTSAKAATGPQGIAHIAGLRPAHLDDAPESVLYTADGQSLQFTLEKWLAGRGQADVAASSQTAGADRVTLVFDHLIAFGVYSVFENHFSANGVTFTPLDGEGSANTFTAGQDGKASIVVTAPAHLTHANAILLVYHSDDADHGVSRGEPGITAHHQLIVRIP